MIPKLIIVGHPCKNILIDLGLWAIDTGRGWLVHGVHRALDSKGLKHE
jgi:hypothetical protein